LSLLPTDISLFKYTRDATHTMALQVGEFVGGCYNLSGNPRVDEAPQAVFGHAASIFVVYSDRKREVYAAEGRKKGLINPLRIN
jgi:hypothetical protein